MSDSENTNILFYNQWYYYISFIYFVLEFCLMFNTLVVQMLTYEDGEKHSILLKN